MVKLNLKIYPKNYIFLIMTWRTNTGDRVLTGWEAILYISAVDSIIDEVDDLMQTWDEDEEALICNWEADDEDEHDILVGTGNRFFDMGKIGQKIYLLAECTKALLLPEIPMPFLDCMNEACAYLPFVHLQKRVEFEIDVEDHREEGWEKWKYYWRKLILAAHKEVMDDISEYEEEDEEYEEEEEEPIDHTSDNLREWKNMIDTLVFEIFWDTDWKFLAIEPQLIEGMYQGDILGIDDDYFTTKLPKVTTEMAHNACKEIHDLYERFTVVSEFLKNNENPTI